MLFKTTKEKLHQGQTEKWLQFRIFNNKPFFQLIWSAKLTSDLIVSTSGFPNHPSNRATYDARKQSVLQGTRKSNWLSAEAHAISGNPKKSKENPSPY